MSSDQIPVEIRECLKNFDKGHLEKNSESSISIAVGSIKNEKLARAYLLLKVSVRALWTLLYRFTRSVASVPVAT